MDREKAILMERAKAIRELTIAIEALREELQLSRETSTISEKESVVGVAESATTTDCISRADTIKAMCLECNVENKCDVWTGGTEDLCADVAIVKEMPPVNQKQVTSKLETAEIATSEGEESTMSQPKSKLKNPCDSLLKPDSDECKEQKRKLDCISRQQAIEEIGRWLGYLDEDMIARIRIGIRNLPSVTPKPVCEDAISRKWVLNEIITKVEDDDSLTDEQKGSLSVAKYIIRHAPPVTPTERTGEWINTGVLTVHCSNCKSEFHELEAMNFCPNCGAKMKGADDE